MEGVHITRSRRKSIELSIDDNLQIAVKAPLWVTDRAIDHFIAQKADWISRQKAAKAAYLQAHPPLTEAEVEALRRRGWQLEETDSVRSGLLPSAPPLAVRFCSTGCSILRATSKVIRFSKIFCLCSS